MLYRKFGIITTLWGFKEARNFAGKVEHPILGGRDARMTVAILGHGTWAICCWGFGFGGHPLKIVTGTSNARLKKLRSAYQTKGGGFRACDKRIGQE